MVRKRYGSKPRGHASQRGGNQAPAAPVRSEKMQALMAAEAEREAREPERRQDGFVPKPKAVRRFERYANMGGRD